MSKNLTMPSLTTTMDRTGHLDSQNMQLEWLELAGRTLDRHVISDSSVPSFIQITGVEAQNSATVSGLDDLDYQNLASLVNHPTLSQLRTVNKVPLPPEVMEHFAHMQCHCLMGLFPEISRAWLTIDSDIYVWSFEHGSDVAYFDGLGETIVSVGLIRPKTGVFQNFVKYLLILTTTVEIVGLGVTFTSSSNNGPLGSVEEMHLVPEPVFVLPTDGVSMMVIKATALGRIFMGGKDGCLYEITYQAQLGWFGKHCKKVNHSTGALSFLVPSFLNVALYDEDPIVKIEIDNSRHILYTLSQKGSVEIYDLGQNGDTLRKINKLSQSKIVHLATDVVKTLEASHFRPIVSISAIENNESEFLNLVAITQGGVRLYFTAGCVCLTPNAPPTTQRPCCLNLLHVRLPPGFAANASVLKPKQVHTAAYENGTLLLISSAAQDSELLWCLSSSAFPRPIASTLVEAHTLLALDGPAWALRRVADDEKKDLSPALLKKKASSINQSVRWVILTASGAHIVQQLGPAELLRHLLLECRGPDSPQVKAFFQMQCPEQACASALLLACGEAGEAAAEWATRAFFLYGGQPALVPAHAPTQGQLFLGQNRFSPRQMSTPMTGRTAANVHQSLQAAVQTSPSPQPQFPTSPNRNIPYSPSSPTTPFSPQHMQYQNMNQSQFGQPNINPPQYQSTLNQSQFNANQFGSPTLNQSQFGLSNLNPSHIVPNPNQSNMGPNFTMGGPMPFNQSVFGNVMQQQQQGAELANYEIHFSAKHNGLYIYVGRILKPIWQMKCVTNTHGIKEVKEFLSSTITGADCSHILQQLYGVRNFLEKNSLGNVNTAQRGKAGQSADVAMSRQLEVHYEEKHSLDALKVFIGISCEMLSLWKILCEHQFHVVAASLPPEQQAALQAASFRELLVGGQEVASLLIMSLINQYLTDNASVDSISDKLREVCPNLYRSEDAACSKANEILLFAKQQKSTAEREEMLRNALKLCKDVAPNVNLPLVCSKFVSAGFYSGVVDLCVACASKIDPQNIALHYYKSDQPSHDHDGYLAYFRRMDIYREVSCALERLYERSIAGPQSCGGAPDPPSTPPRATASDVTGSLSPADANYQARKVVSDCLTYSDELLHVSVYEWMLSKRLHGELLALAPARSLRDYLARAARAAASPQLHDLLWKFYERNGEHVAAATVLEGLATRPGGGLTLAQRAAYLWQGVVCVRGGGAGGELLRRLEEAGEVARLQARVLDALSAVDPPPPPHTVQRLHDQLLDVSVLYEEYAEAYNLWECKLAIVHCSGHNDALLVEGIWSRILAGAEAAARDASTPDERMGAVLSKVSALAREYVNSGHCFPLVFIVRQLEIMCCKMRADPGLVSKALLEVGVSIDQLLDVYIKLIGMNERVWMSEGNELHLLEAAALLMEHFTRDKVPFNAQVKRRVMVKCQDLISSSFNTLYTKPDTQELVKVLRGIQSKLDRME